MLSNSLVIVGKTVTINGPGADKVAIDGNGHPILLIDALSDSVTDFGSDVCEWAGDQFPRCWRCHSSQCFIAHAHRLHIYEQRRRRGFFLTLAPSSSSCPDNVFTQCKFLNNQAVGIGAYASAFGGAISIDTPGNYTIDNCQFTGNQAIGDALYGSANGGAISLAGSQQPLGGSSHHHQEQHLQ